MSAPTCPCAVTATKDMQVLLDRLHRENTDLKIRVEELEDGTHAECTSEIEHLKDANNELWEALGSIAELVKRYR